MDVWQSKLMAIGKLISDIMKRFLGHSPCPLVPLQAYWRSCAALLGQILETAFKDDITVELLSSPEVPGRGVSLYVSNLASAIRRCVSIRLCQFVHEKPEWKQKNLNIFMLGWGENFGVWIKGKFNKVKWKQQINNDVH